MLNFDVVIIGSGLAGLSTALKLADKKKIAIISKRQLIDSSSHWAQGGIASTSSSEDSVDKHVSDTLAAGADLCDEQVVRFVSEHSPAAIQWLQNIGVDFTKQATNNLLHFTQEGGHTVRRIAHVADTTGKAVQSVLIQKVLAHPNIRIFEDHIVVDLITNKKIDLSETGKNECLGMYVLENFSGKVSTIRSGVTILASGGASKVYLYTTNPDVSTGDGMAMAWRAGCRLANMEFIQFHPTCLFHPKEKSFLISEALRGEGAVLKLPNNKPFMHLYDARGDLAPRDIVARAIDYEMKKRGIECVYLDITHRTKSFIMDHFPTIYERCLKLNIDISKEQIPVVPAAHYSCGGVITKLNGETDIKNLYAIGEVAYTGLHGANRLASNSLLECLVFAEQAAQNILAQPGHCKSDLPQWDESRVTDADEEVLITHTWNELRRFMWNYVGIVRTNKRLSRAMHRINMLRDEVQEFYQNFRISNNLIELRNLLQVAQLIVESAIERKESRGLHYSRDFPNKSAEKKITVLTPDNFNGERFKKNKKLTLVR
ncbi:MAG: L-aspartate oxidase [Methylophilaceae bacterium]